MLQPVCLLYHSYVCHITHLCGLMEFNEIFSHIKVKNSYIYIYLILSLSGVTEWYFLLVRNGIVQGKTTNLLEKCRWPSTGLCCVTLHWLYNLRFLPYNIRVKKSKGMRWAGACNMHGKNMYKVSVRKLEGKISLEKTRCKWADIEMDLKEIRTKGMDWIHLA